MNTTLDRVILHQAIQQNGILAGRFEENRPCTITKLLIRPPALVSGGQPIAAYKKAGFWRYDEHTITAKQRCIVVKFVKRAGAIVDANQTIYHYLPYQTYEAVSKQKRLAADQNQQHQTNRLKQRNQAQTLKEQIDDLTLRLKLTDLKRPCFESVELEQAILALTSTCLDLLSGISHVPAQNRIEAGPAYLDFRRLVVLLTLYAEQKVKVKQNNRIDAEEKRLILHFLDQQLFRQLKADLLEFQNDQEQLPEG